MRELDARHTLAIDWDVAEQHHRGWRHKKERQCLGGIASASSVVTRDITEVEATLSMEPRRHSHGTCQSETARGHGSGLELSVRLDQNTNIIVAAVPRP